MKIIKAIHDFFKAEKTVYSHRNRTIEIIALEKGIDLTSLETETRIMIERQGKVEAIEQIRCRFHSTLSAAWRFVDKFDVK